MTEQDYEARYEPTPDGHGLDAARAALQPYALMVGPGFVDRLERFEAAARADEIERLRTEHATWRKLGQRNLERAHEENARLRAVLERIRVAVRRLAAHAVGFGDVLDESDRGPWGKTVAADIAVLRRMADEAQPNVMPHDRAEYDRMRDTNPRPGPCCTAAGPVPHWPMWAHCGGGNGPGKPIRPHCTCDSCF